MYRLLLFLLVLLFAACVNAGEFVSSRALGMGRAGCALVTGNDSIMLNAAGMSVDKNYSLYLGYLVTPDAGTSDGPLMHVINVSVVDNKIAPFAMGLSYTRVKGSDFKTGNRVDLAFSVPLGQSFFIGTDIKYIDFDQLGIEDRTETVTLDVGAMLRSSFGLNLAVVGYNLTNPKDYIDHPVSMAVGLSWTLFQSLNLAADWFINFQNPSDLQDLSKKKEIGHCAFVGAEYTFMEMISLRAGYIFDRTELDQNEHYWTVGVGYVSLSGKFNFGYQGNIHHTWGGIFGVSIELFI